MPADPPAIGRPPQPNHPTWKAPLENKLCVLIDFENVAAGTEKEGLGRFDIRAVMRRLKDKGRILVARSYGDWGRFAKFKQRFLEQGVTMVEMTSYRGQDKNRADIALVVDAMEIAFTRPYIDTFVLVSGDSDFTPIVMRLKELDRRVIGMGTRGSTSRLLVESCDEFIFYKSLLKQATPERSARAESNEQREKEPAADAEPARSLSKAEAFELLSETVSGIMREDAGEVLAGLVKQSMLRKEPAFDETEYGYPGFARFLEAARDKGLIKIARDSRAGGYRVDLPGDGSPTDAAASTDGGDAPSSPDEHEEAALPVLEGRAGELAGILEAAGNAPLTHMIRHTVVHEFVDHISERERRKKRNTLTYVYGDISRRCRKTDPYIPAAQVKQVINSLKGAGEMLHNSGSPVRSQNANFTINKDAEELLESLRRFYIGTLLDAEADLSDSAAVSTLLWGDEEHVVDCEELVAWVQHERTVEESAGDEALEPDEAPAAEAAAEAAPEGEADAAETTDADEKAEAEE